VRHVLSTDDCTDVYHQLDLASNPRSSTTMLMDPTMTETEYLPPELHVPWRQAANALALAARSVDGAGKRLAAERLSRLTKAGKEYEAALNTREAYLAELGQLSGTREARYHAAFIQCDSVCRYAESILLETDAHPELLGSDVGLPVEPWNTLIAPGTADLGAVTVSSLDGCVSRITACRLLKVSRRVVRIEARRGRIVEVQDFARGPGKRWVLRDKGASQPLVHIEVTSARGRPHGQWGYFIGGTGKAEVALEQRVNSVRYAAAVAPFGLPPVVHDLVDRTFEDLKKIHIPPLARPIPQLSPQAIAELHELVRHARELTTILTELPWIDERN